jgi:SAM-dependent methyltransferase
MLARVKNAVFNYILKPMGFQKRVSKQIWEQQFSTGYWDFLGSENENEHYNVIIDFFLIYKKEGKILDIGSGKGVLLSHLTQKTPLTYQKYTGIDISRTAIAYSLTNFPLYDFKVCDYDKENLEGKYDIIIFNETLYYFLLPAQTLKKCIKNNLNTGGLFIISIYNNQGEHDGVWKNILPLFDIVEEKKATNNQNQLWDIKVLKPKV